MAAAPTYCRAVGTARYHAGTARTARHDGRMDGRVDGRWTDEEEEDERLYYATKREHSPNSNSK